MWSMCSVTCVCCGLLVSVPSLGTVCVCASGPVCACGLCICACWGEWAWRCRCKCRCWCMRLCVGALVRLLMRLGSCVRGCVHLCRRANGSSFTPSLATDYAPTTTDNNTALVESRLRSKYPTTSRLTSWCWPCQTWGSWTPPVATSVSPLQLPTRRCR